MTERHFHHDKPQPKEMPQVIRVESSSIDRFGDLSFQLEGGVHLALRYGARRSGSDETPSTSTYLSVTKSHYHADRVSNRFDKLGTLFIDDDGSSSITGDIDTPDRFLPWLIDQMDVINPRTTYVDPNSSHYAAGKSDQAFKVGDYLDNYTIRITRLLDAWQTAQTKAADDHNSSS